jgi:hypothetical protein
MKLRLYHKTLIVLHIVMIAAVIFVSVGLYFVGRTVNTAVTQNTSDIHALFDVLNRPRTGTIAGANQVIFGADALLKQTNGIVNHEEKQLTTLDQQEQKFFDDFHTVAFNAGTTVATIGDTAKAATGTLNNATAVLATVNDSKTGIGPMIVAGTKTINDIDFFANDPHVKAFIANLEPLSNNAVAITGSGAVIAKNLGETTTDFQTKFHTWLYPVPCKTASCKWGKVFNFALDVSKFAEPFDLVTQGYESIKK